MGTLSIMSRVTRLLGPTLLVQGRLGTRPMAGRVTWGPRGESLVQSEGSVDDGV